MSDVEVALQLILRLTEEAKQVCKTKRDITQLGDRSD